MRSGPVYEIARAMSPVRRPDYVAYAVLAAALGSLGAEIWALVRALELLLSR
jgi:hypothetical protein